MTSQNPVSVFKFCPKCGGALTAQRQEGKPLLVCVQCDFHFYQNVSTTTALLIERSGNILLVRRGIEPSLGLLDVPGGFVDWGEEAEDGAKREAQEELGVSLSRLVLFGTYHDWYHTQGLALSVLALYYAATIHDEPKAGSDASSIEWHALGALPKDQFAFPHMRKALRDYLRFRKRKLPAKSV